MEWKLYGKNKEFLQEVNCQYDACDIATMMYGAKKIELDFEKKEAYIVRVEQIQQNSDTYQIGVDKREKRSYNIIRNSEKDGDGMNKKDLYYRFENKNWMVEVEWVTWEADPTDHIKATVLDKKTHDKYVAWQDVGHGETELGWTNWELRCLPKTILKKADSFAKKIYKQLLKYAEY